MKIFDGKKYFSLDVIGYEFPEAVDYYDANWLNIRIDAADEHYNWTAKDGCLLTTELKELCAWFESLDSCHEGVLSIDFMEGELKYGYDCNEKVLSVIFDFNFHPKGEDFIYGEGGDEEYIILFRLDKNDNKRLVSSLEEIVREFPIRGSL